MKSLAVTLFIALLSVPALNADDACCATESTSIQEKIRNIDLNIALKKYEQIATEKAKAEVQLALLETESGNDEERLKQLELIHARIQRLSSYTSELKERMIALTKVTEVASSK